MTRTIRFAFLLLLLLASSGAGLATATAQDAQLRFVVVSHGQASDPFWSVVQRGTEAASEDLGVEVEYQAPTTYDMVAMSQLIDAAVASQPDGLVVSIPDAAALSPSIQRAVEAGIPVVSINSGSDVAADLGVLTHVGQTEKAAGVGGGERLAEAGVTNSICLIHEAGNAGLEERCAGYTEAMTAAGGTVEQLVVDLNNPTEATQRVQAALAANAEINGIMALGPTGAVPALQAIEAAGKTGAVQIATFDLSSEVLEAIQAGTMLFAIDQQQYEQGYLPIILLNLYVTNANTIANPILMTGPGFVTADNVEEVIDLTAEGTR